MKNFVLQYAAFHSEFEQSLRAEFAGELVGEQQSYRQMVREILGPTGKGRIAYGQLFSLMKPLERLLNQGEDMIEEGRYKESFSLARSVAEEVTKALYNMNDSSGVAAEVVSQALKLMKQIGIKAEEDLSGSVFTFARKALSKKKFSDFGHEEDIWTLLIELADRPSREESVTVLIDHYMSEAEKEKSEHRSRFLQSRLLRYKHRLLKNRGKTEEADKLIKDHPEVPEFVEHRITRYMEQQEYEKARRLLENRLEAETERSDLREQWMKKLLEVGQKQGDTGLVRRIARQFMQGYGSGRKYYTIYKNTFDEQEWQEEVERLVQTLKQQESVHLLPLIYREEGRWRELTKFFQEHPDLDAIERDADKLLEADANQTFAAYEKALDTYAERNTGRPYYREICGRLRTLSQWEGGEERARKIIQKYRKKFKRRPAMMEELDKLGME